MDEFRKTHLVVNGRVGKVKAHMGKYKQYATCYYRCIAEAAVHEYTYAFEQFDFVESCFRVVRRTFDHFEGNEFLLPERARKCNNGHNSIV